MKTTLLSTMFLLAATMLQAQTIYVKPNATGDGTSWSNATDLETAVTRATSGTQIWVQEGAYYPKTMLTVANNVALYGGFVGTEISVLQRDLTDKVTIIDAQKKYGSVIRLGASATLNSFTIQNGDAQHNPQRSGGGVWADDNAIIENCTIINNAAMIDGGGIYSKGPSRVIGTTVRDNTARGSGDDVYGCVTIISEGTSSGGSDVIVLYDTVTLRDTVYSEMAIPDTVVIFDPSGALTATSTIEIVTHPSATAQTKGESEAFTALSVSATSSQPLNYQWYATKSNYNVMGTPIEGATGTSYTRPTVTIALDNSIITGDTTRFYYYYCVVSNSVGSVASNVSGLHTYTNYCNSNTPGFTSGTLGTVEYIKSGTAYSATSTAHETTVSGNGITQTWSGFVRASGCNKTSYSGGSAGNYNADCRSASNRANFGDWFSWCAVERYKDELCPAPWRVPTAQDFVDLDKALLNGDGSNRNVTSNGTEITAYRAMGTNQWGCTNGTSSWIGYTASTSGANAVFVAVHSGRIVSLAASYIHPQSGYSRDNGGSLRCIKD